MGRDDKNKLKNSHEFSIFNSQNVAQLHAVTTLLLVPSKTESIISGSPFAT
jgi:hypothetical protein